MGEVCLHTPKPTQDVYSENGNSSSGGNPGEGLFCAWFSMCKAVAAYHNCDQAGDPCNRSGEEGFKCGETAIEGQAADLREGQDGKCEDNYEWKGSSEELSLLW